MKEKKNSLNSLKDLTTGVSGTSTNSQKNGKFEKLKAKEEVKNRYPVRSVGISEDTKKKESVGFKDTPLQDLTTEQKSAYKWFSFDKPGRKVKPSEEYEKSEEYIGYEKEKGIRNQARLEGNTDKLFNKIFEETKDTTNDILNVQTMSKNGELKLNPLPVPENTDNKNKDNIEQKISPEDLNIRNEVYKLTDEYEKSLKVTTTDKQTQDRNKRELDIFKETPYGSTRIDLINRLRKITDIERSRKPKTGVEQRNLARAREELKGKLTFFDKAYERKIPLKLDREFTDKEIKRYDGVLFNIDEYKKEINNFLGTEDANFSIIRVVQRGDSYFLVLKTDSEEILEFPTDIADDLLESKTPKKKQESPAATKEIPLTQTPEYKELQKIIDDRKELQRLEQKKLELEQKLKEIEEQEKRESLTLRLDKDTLLSREFKNKILVGLFNTLKDKKPEQLDLTIRPATNNLTLRTDINFKNLNGWISSTGKAHIEIPLVNDKNGELTIGEYFIKTGMAGSALKEEIESALPNVLSGMKTLFENIKGKPVESMKIQNGEIVILFKEN